MLIAPKGYPQANDSVELRWSSTGKDEDATVILSIMKRGYTGKPLAGAAERAEEIDTWRGRRVFFWGGGSDWPTAKADILAALKATDAPAAETQPATQPVMSNLAKRVASSMPEGWELKASTQPTSRPAESHIAPMLDDQQVEYLLKATSRPASTATLTAPRVTLYGGSKAYVEMRHSAPASCPAPTSQPGKATLDGEPVDGLGKSLTIQHQAATLADLLAKAKPDFTFDDDGRDMMWIEGKDTDKPSFRLGRAFMYKPVDGDAGFVLLESNFEGGPPDDAVSVVRCIAPPSVARLLDERPVHDGGSGDYAIVKSRGPSGAVLYEVGWQSEYLARWAKERRLYVLRTGDQWALVGEGPAEGYSKTGYCQQVGTTVDARVEWTQKPDASVRMHFVATETRSEWASSDMLQEDPSASDAMRDDLVKRREWVLQGKLPATRQAVTDRPHMLARRGDNLDKLVRHLSSWTPGARESALKIQAVWKRELTRLNADLFAGEIPEGRRINLPTDAEVAKLISP
jgi:hypothetical protein